MLDGALSPAAASRRPAATSRHAALCRAIAAQSIRCRPSVRGGRREFRAVAATCRDGGGPAVPGRDRDHGLGVLAAAGGARVGPGHAARLRLAGGSCLWRSAVIRPTGAEWRCSDGAGTSRSGYEDPVICSHDLSKFGARLAVDIMRTHPVVIVGGILRISSSSSFGSEAW